MYSRSRTVATHHPLDSWVNNGIHTRTRACSAAAHIGQRIRTTRTTSTTRTRQYMFWWCAHRYYIPTVRYSHIHIERRTTIVQMTLENSMPSVSSFSHQSEVSKQTDVFPNPSQPSAWLIRCWLFFVRTKYKHTINSIVTAHMDAPRIFGCYLGTVTISMWSAKNT